MVFPSKWVQEMSTQSVTVNNKQIANKWFGHDKTATKQKEEEEAIAMTNYITMLQQKIWLHVKDSILHILCYMQIHTIWRCKNGVEFKTYIC